MRSLVFFASFALPFAIAHATPTFSPKFARVQQDAQPIPCALPGYPKSSQRSQEMGSTTIRFAISPDGEVFNVTVLKSSGFRDLDRAAIVAMGKCRFTPASIAGTPVQAIMLAQYHWGLEK